MPAGVDGTVMLCETAPPSDQPLKTYANPGWNGEACGVGASIVCVSPTFQFVNVRGAVYRTPSTMTFSPAGTVVIVTGTVGDAGLMVTPVYEAVSFDVFTSPPPDTLAVFVKVIGGL